MVIKIEEEKENPTIIENLEIVWKDKLTTAEWLAEQSDLIRNQYNAWIKLMPKCMKKGHLSDKEIRMMPIDQFLDLVQSFLKKYGLASDYNFLE